MPLARTSQVAEAKVDKRATAASKRATAAGTRATAAGIRATMAGKQAAACSDGTAFRRR